MNLLDGQKPDPQELLQFKSQDILSAEQFSAGEVEIILRTAAYYEKQLAAKKRLYDMDGQIMAALFFEPSTRTRLSFESAMCRLGGSVITVAESAASPTSSTAKGESLHDAANMVNNYADVIVCRSPMVGSARIMAAAAEVPVINAGDGIGQHPSQALLDIYTICQEKGGVEGLTVALIGDLKNGRTVHSLLYLLSFHACRVILVSPRELQMPQELVERMRMKGMMVEVAEDLSYACREADVLYMTRVQKERFESEAAYNQVKDRFILDERYLPLLRPRSIILHPLPRLNEIATSVDAYAGAAYFRQARNGLPVRMALLALVTGNVR